MNKIKLLLLLLLLVSFSFFGEAKTVVLVSLPPQAFLVKSLLPASLQKEVEVQVLVGPGQNYHSYEVPPRDVEKFSKASLYFTLGIPFEKSLLKKFQQNSTKLKIIPMDKDIVRREMSEAEEDNHGHGHGHGDKHDHHHHHDIETGDPHVWLSIANLLVMTSNTSKVLKENFPQYSTDIEKQTVKFKNELEQLKVNFTKSLMSFKGKTLFVYHPSFGYFTDEYGLVQRSIEINGRSPGPRELQAFIERAKKEKAEIIFFQPQFDKRSCEVVASTLSKSLGKKVIVRSLDALAEDVLKTLKEIEESITYSSQGG